MGQLAGVVAGGDCRRQGGFLVENGLGSCWPHCVGRFGVLAEFVVFIEAVNQTLYHCTKLRVRLCPGTFEYESK